MVVEKNGEIQYPFDECIGCQKRTCVENCNSGGVCLAGKEMDSDEVIEILAKDIPFYKNSGGGVTFSGGEPLAQSDFLLDLLKKCRKLDIHTAIETCGFADIGIFQQILPYTNLFLFDLKIIDPAMHLKYTGRPVQPVLDNLACIARLHIDISIRVPLVQGITDRDENLEAIAKVMINNKLNMIFLEPYHSLGVEKYHELGMEYSLPNLGEYLLDKAEDIRQYFLMNHFDCSIV